MGGSKTSLGFLVLLPIVLFSGTSSGEFGDDPARGSGRVAPLLDEHGANILFLQLSRILQASLLHPIFPSGCEGKLGVALESLQGLRDLT